MAAAPLQSDQRGAMFIMGIPIVFLMIGTLYFAIGLGEEFVLRGRAQDAADAAAYSAAVMHARGMNMIALVNQVMASLVALLVMLRMLQALMMAAIAIAGALAYWTGGASLSIVPPATEAQQQAGTAYEQLKNVVDPILRGLHYFEVGIKYGMPVMAEVRVVDIVQHHYRPPADLGFVVPGSFPLPVKEGKWDELCGKAGEYAGEMILMPIDAIISVGAVKDAIGGAIGGLAKTFSAAFCGNGGLTIPKELPPIDLAKEITHNLPELESEKQCAAQTPPVTNQQQATDLSYTLQQDQNARIEGKQQECDRAADEMKRARQGSDGGPNELCRGAGGQACREFQTKADQAAKVCRAGGTEHKIDSYNYQLRELTWKARLIPVPGPAEDEANRRYRLEWATAQPEYEDSAREQVKKPPCGQGGEIDGGYNASATYRAGGYGPGEMLCEERVKPSQADAQALAASGGSKGKTLAEWQAEFDDKHWRQDTEAYDPDVDPAQAADPNVAQRVSTPGTTPTIPVFIGTWRGVPFMHSCNAKYKSFDEVDYTPPPNDQGDFGGSQAQSQNGGNGCGQNDSMVHHTMEEGHHLGDETFQMRSVIIRGSSDTTSGKLVEEMPFVRAGERRSTAFADMAGALSKIFVAQAEYYFDTGYDKKKKRPQLDQEQWMWNMHWRARLRRVRFSLEEDGDNQSGNAGGAGSTAGGTKKRQQAPASCGFGDIGSSLPNGADGMLGGAQELAEGLMVH